MVEPPPPAPNNSADSSVTTSLLKHIHNLHDLLFNILLPKTKTAKSATIPLEALYCARDLATLACTSLHECCQDPCLDNINKQLDTITTHLGIPSATQTPFKPSYASVLAAGTQCPASPPKKIADKLHPPCARACFDFTLVQKACDQPVLTDLTNENLIDNIYEALNEADCWHELQPNTPDSDGNIVYDTTEPRIRAVGCHPSGDIRVVAASEAEHDTLTSSINKWLPKLSDGLTFIHKTYPVLIHGIPTSFDTSRNS